MRKRIENRLRLPRSFSPYQTETSTIQGSRIKSLVKRSSYITLLPICILTMIFLVSLPNHPKESSTLVDSKLARNVGNGWQVDDWKEKKSTHETVEKEVTFKCLWATFRPSVAVNNTAEMCVHPFRDIVSNSIKGHGRWGDCDLLSSLWNEQVHDEDSVYLEVGANIGSCVMEMLLGTNANIIAFEPHPMNCYALRQTISKLNSTLHDRVRLVCVGLGHKQETSTIYAASNNMGNSIIGTIVKDAPSQQFDENLQFQVPIERLDSMVKSGTNVKLMKMDAQGFECNVMEGMGQDLASGIENIQFEYAKHWLDGLNCTDLPDRMRKYGFDIYRHYAEGKFVNLYAGTPTWNNVGDLYASRQKK